METRKRGELADRSSDFSHGRDYKKRLGELRGWERWGRSLKRGQEGEGVIRVSVVAIWSSGDDLPVDPSCSSVRVSDSRNHCFHLFTQPIFHSNTRLKEELMLRNAC